MAAQCLVHGPLGGDCLHLCVDMQRLFGPGYPWAVPRLENILPAVEAVCGRQPHRTVFTRFIPARRVGEGRGTWARYYRRWAAVTLDLIGPDAVRLVPSLERFVPPARTVDKFVYSPWTEGRLDRLVRATGVDTLIMTGTETDVCVLATVLGAIDRGLRVIVVTDALCGSSDETHDALLSLYRNRFTEQIEGARTEEVVESWR